MKFYKKYFSVICAGLLFFSCNDYLESKSNSTFQQETVFSNIEFANFQILGLYNCLASSELYEVNLLYFKCDNDVEHLPTKSDGTYSSIAHYEADPGTSLLSNTWNKFYSTIESANVAIAELPKSPMWTDSKNSGMAKRLYGEALTIRALCYYEMIFFWGDVPFKAEPTSPGDNFYVPKTDRDQIYLQMIDDLAVAQEYVPWLSEIQTTERISKGFVKGLRARMALAYAGYSLRNITFETRRGENWRDYYEIANQECREIMESGEHQLKPSYENVFKDMHAYKVDTEYGEVMFEVAFGRLTSGRVCNTIGMSYGTNSPDPKYGRAAGAVATNPTYYYGFDKSDIRRDINAALFNYSGANGKQVRIGTSGFRTTKWRKMWITPAMGGSLASVQFTGVNWPMMRYADIVLMFAETENELNNGPTQDAKDALASIRERVFDESLYGEKVTDYITAVSASKEAFFEAIVDERAWEFGGELMRKFDLIRWNLLGTKLDEITDIMTTIVATPDAPAYNWVPSVLYYRLKSDDETLEFLNPDYRLNSAPSVPSGETAYSSITWFGGFSETSATNYLRDIFSIIASGYKKELNNYLLPIANTVITSSNGSLSNDQWRSR